MKIRWSELAQEDIAEVISFLDNKFGPNAAINFLDRVDQSLPVIENSPSSFLCIDPKRKVYKFIINKHVTLYYKLGDDMIYLITFRQNSRGGSTF